MLSPQEKRDKVIRATDLDALSCRFSANNQSYLEPKDEYIDKLISSYQSNLQFCDGYSNLSAGRTLRSIFNERKLPLINRGTYFRTKSIDAITEEFINEHNECQIISLGGGSDTRGFRVLKEHENVRYVEIDFPESVKIKKIAILRDESLKQIVGHDDSPKLEINTKEQFREIHPDFHTNSYHLIGIDLRKLSSKEIDQESGTLLNCVNESLPTLVLSECALCYVSLEENENIINFWKQHCKDLVSFLIYEPMSLNDAFGKTMAKNLMERGINLQTFNALPNLESRKQFLSERCNLSKIKLTDMSDVGGYSKGDNSKPWIKPDDLKRINSLELIDEIEEIRLLFDHYCLCYGEFNSGTNGRSFQGINMWNWRVEDH